VFGGDGSASDLCFAFIFLLVFFLFGLVIDADISLAHLFVLSYSANILQHCIAGRIGNILLGKYSTIGKRN
jgi:hypothetical protein